jgi:type IV pilus assembly protein PilA
METAMKRIQKGFTLIELMIVVAIIGILAAIALPAYQDYTIRSKVVEALTDAGNCKTSVTEYFTSKNGALPADLTASGCSNVSTANVQSLDVTAGVVTVAIQSLGGDTAAGDTVIFTPTQNTTNAGQLDWTCTGGTVKAKYRPAACR